MKMLAAGTTFVFAAVIAAVLLAFAMGGLGLGVSLVSLTAGAVAAGLAWRDTERPPRQPFGFWDWAMVGVFTLVSLRSFLWLISTHGDEIYVLSPNNLGDISLHLNFIRYLAGGVPFWPESPLLTGAPLTYPLGADLFNALGEICGLDTHRGLVWAGLVGAALTGAALWRWGGAFGLAALLFNGGLAGFAVLASGRFEDFQSELIWKNFFLSMFVTQRGLLFALPAGLILLHAWREEFFRQERRVLPLWLQLVFYAGMPLFSLHSFIFLSAVLAGMFCVQRSRRRILAKVIGAAFLPATVAVLLVTGRFFSSGGMHLAFGWIMNQKGWADFVVDFGLTLPLGLLAGVMAFRSRDSEARAFAGSAIGVFALCIVVSFARWEWDNMKLMLWAWLTLAPCLWTRVLQPLPVVPRAALCALLFFSGAASLIGGLDARHGYSLAKRSELDLWRAATAHIPMETRFAAEPEFNHPLILLGRKVACGYSGHLWSHGLDYEPKMNLLKQSLAGSMAWSQSAPLLGVEWLVIRKKDRHPGTTSPTDAILDLRPFLRGDRQSPAAPPKAATPPEAKR